MSYPKTRHYKSKQSLAQLFPTHRTVEAMIIITKANRKSDMIKQYSLGQALYLSQELVNLKHNWLKLKSI